MGPVETWKADRISIWHPGHHDNPFGIRLSAMMIPADLVLVIRYRSFSLAIIEDFGQKEMSSPGDRVRFS